MTLRKDKLLLFLALSAGCNSATEETSGDGNGDSPSGSISESGGDSGSVGAGGASSGKGSTPSGGKSGDGNGGSGGTEGLGKGGALETGGHSADGGGHAAGDGGAGTGGAIAPEHTPVPSSGCERASANPRVVGLDENTQLYVSTPEGYDGVTPGPLVIGLNANGPSLAPMERVSPTDATPSDLARDFLVARIHRVYGPAYTWELTELSVYDEAYEELEKSLCFDKSRIFGVGNAAGSRFFTRWIHEDSPNETIVRPKDFRAIAYTGALLFLAQNAPWPDVPTVFIHSVYDWMAYWLTHDADGSTGLAGIQMRMECGEDSVSAGASSLDGATTNCTDFTDCIGALRFCSYDKETEGDEWQSLYTTEVHRFFMDYL